MVNIDLIKPSNKPQKVCTVCNKYLYVKNPYIQCSSCKKYTHINCININYPDVKDILTSYKWECHECKKCSICHSESTEKTMLLCDRCDKGSHINCLNPPLKKEPEGKWLCDECKAELENNESNKDLFTHNNKSKSPTKKALSLNIGLRKNSLSKIKISLDETKINILKPKRKNTTLTNSKKESHINILQPRRKSINETTTNTSHINLLKPSHKSASEVSIHKTIDQNTLVKRKPVNSKIESVPKTTVKRIFIKVPPRRKVETTDEEKKYDENDNSNNENEKDFNFHNSKFLDIDDDDYNEDEDTTEDDEDIDIENIEENDDEEYSDDEIDIIDTDEEDEDEENESIYYEDDFFEDDMNEEEKALVEKEKALINLKKKYKELRKIVEQLRKNALDIKKVKNNNLQSIIDKVKKISSTTNIKLPIMNVNNVKSITEGLKYIERQFTTSSPLDYFDASVLGSFGPLKSISPILNSGFSSLQKTSRKRKRNEPSFSSIDDRIRYNNPILANTIFSRDTPSNKKPFTKFEYIPSPSTNYTIFSNSKPPSKIVNNALVKKASPAIREYLGEEGADTSLCMPNKNDYRLFVGLKKEIEEYQINNEDLKILHNSPEFINNENEELKKAKKLLEASKQDEKDGSENPTPIDEYSEQILKADQSLKEDCIKPVDISKNKAIKFGSYLIKMWFASPYPAEYSERPILYLCEYCFKYLNSEYALSRHQKKCPIKVPPGNEIYRDNNISIFEVDGRKNKIYCQNLCLLSKLFLDHKTLYYDVEPFLFYIMTLPKDKGYKFIGYFSKEKQCESGYNLSCLLTLPIYQRKGYGNALIEFSYMLSQVEGKLGSPEKPLSDFGLRSYRKYWRYKVLKELAELYLAEDELNIEEISRKTSITENDVWCTLYNCGILRKVKTHKAIGHHRSITNSVDLLFIDEKDNDFLINKKYELYIDPEKIISYVQDVESKIKIKLDPKYLRWNLYNMMES